MPPEEINIDAAADSIATGILGEGTADSLDVDLYAADSDADPAADAAAEQGVDPAADAAADPDVDPAADAADPDVDTDADQAADTDLVASDVPKTWPKEMHEHWAKTPPEVQEYWQTREKQMLDGLAEYKGSSEFGRSLKDVIAPFEATIQSYGLDAPTAVQHLMQANHMLTSGTTESRQAAYKQLGEDLGLTQAPADPNAVAPSPEMTALQNDMNQLKSTMSQREQAALSVRREQAATEISDFASDPAHPYFDEVADDVLLLINSGASLEDAYEKSVWGNPITRQKELDRVQAETAEKKRTDDIAKAEAAKAAKSVNVKTRNTPAAPTEKLGSMDDTLSETMNAIKSRSH